jgi:hypothetical protein
MNNGNNSNKETREEEAQERNAWNSTAANQPPPMWMRIRDQSPWTRNDWN